MSIEDLESDLDANVAQLQSLSSMSTVGDVVDHLKKTLWPFLENVVKVELKEMDGSISDVVNNAEDILQPETGRLFSTVVLGGIGLVGELEKRLTKSAEDTKILSGIREWQKYAQEATEVLSEIVLPEEEDDEPETEDDDGQEEER